MLSIWIPKISHESSLFYCKIFLQLNFTNIFVIIVIVVKEKISYMNLIIKRIIIENYHLLPHASKNMHESIFRIGSVHRRAVFNVMTSRYSILTPTCVDIDIVATYVTTWSHAKICLCSQCALSTRSTTRHVTRLAAFAVSFIKVSQKADTRWK